MQILKLRKTYSFNKSYANVPNSLQENPFPGGAFQVLNDTWKTRRRAITSLHKYTGQILVSQAL